MNTDRELLELAAKAADYPIRGWSGNVLLLECDVSKPAPQIYCPTPWSSLTNDGDALRLAVKLRIKIWFSTWPSGKEYVAAHKIWNCQTSMYEDDGIALNGKADEATRRAITLAAAAIQLAKEIT